LIVNAPTPHSQRLSSKLIRRSRSEGSRQDRSRSEAEQLSDFGRILFKSLSLTRARRPSTCCSHFVSRRLNHYGAADSLDTAFRNTSENLDLLKQQSLNARKMAKELFDQTKNYQKLTEFILNS
jgi:hypothetical protein